MYLIAFLKKDLINICAPFISLFVFTGVTKISRCSRYSAYLHWEHCCELISIKARAPQSNAQCCSRGGWRDTQCSSGGGGSRGGTVCGRLYQ